MQLRRLIADIIYKNLLKESTDEYDFYDFYEIRDEMLYNTLNDIKNAKPNTRQPWKVVPFAKLKNCWESFMKYGFVRDEKVLNDIATLVVHNILQVDINTELMGHKQYLPIDEMKDIGITKEELAETRYFDTDGQWRLSDYAIDTLMELAFKIYKEKNAEAKLVLVDRALNVIHQRSDIAEWFVQGGSKSLNKLSGSPSDTNEEDE